MNDEEPRGLSARIAAIQPHQWIAAGVAVAAIASIGGLFFAEALYGYWKPAPIVVYFENWESDRGIEDALTAQESEIRLREDTEALADRLAAEAMAGLEDGRERVSQGQETE